MYWTNQITTDIEGQEPTRRRTHPKLHHRQSLPRRPCHRRRTYRSRNQVPRPTAQAEEGTRCRTSHAGTRGGGADRPPREKTREEGYCNVLLNNVSTLYILHLQTCPINLATLMNSLLSLSDEGARSPTRGIRREQFVCVSDKPCRNAVYGSKATYQVYT